MCRYHLLKPEYIHHRIKELQRSFRLRVLLCHVDIDDVVEPLQQITRAALLNDVTLICSWSPEVDHSPPPPPAHPHLLAHCLAGPIFTAMMVQKKDHGWIYKLQIPFCRLDQWLTLCCLFLDVS